MPALLLRVDKIKMAASSTEFVEKVNKTTSGDVETFKEFSKIYNTMSEACFDRCVWDFGTTQIRDREDRCIMRCAQNYLQMTKVVGATFTEEQTMTVSLPSQ